MQSEFFKRHQTNYEELQNKKLNEFYVVVQMVSTELLLGEGTILQPSKVTMLYGLDILGYRTIIGGVRIDIWTHFMRECIIDYVH